MVAGGSDNTAKQQDSQTAKLNPWPIAGQLIDLGLGRVRMTIKSGCRRRMTMGEWSNRDNAKWMRKKEGE